MARDPGTETWQSSKTLERGDQRKPRRLLMLPGLWGPLPLLMADLLTCLLITPCSHLASRLPQRAPAVCSLTISVHRCSRSSPPGRFPVGLSAHIPKGRNLMALLPLLWPASWSSAFWPCVLPSLSQLQLGEQSHLEFFKLRVRTHTRIHTIM